MQIDTDGKRFDDLQPWYVGDLIESIRRNLEEAGIKGSVLKELCGNIAFNVCTQIDSSSTFEVDGQEYGSFLVFADGNDKYFYPGGNSYLHEYVFGVLEEIFADDA